MSLPKKAGGPTTHPVNNQMGLFLAQNDANGVAVPVAGPYAVAFNTNWTPYLQWVADQWNKQYGLPSGAGTYYAVIPQ